jgi:hypothetical protein
VVVAPETASHVLLELLTALSSSLFVLSFLAAERLFCLIHISSLSLVFSKKVSRLSQAGMTSKLNT